MANLADLQVIRIGDRFAAIACTSGRPDNEAGAWWVARADDGQTIGHGFSRGWDGNGAGSMLSAAKNAKRCARRYFARQAKREER